MALKSTATDVASSVESLYTVANVYINSTSKNTKLANSPSYKELLQLLDDLSAKGLQAIEKLVKSKSPKYKVRYKLVRPAHPSSTKIDEYGHKAKSPHGGRVLCTIITEEYGTFTGVAKCMQENVFNGRVGKNIARGKALSRLFEEILKVERRDAAYKNFLESPKPACKLDSSSKVAQEVEDVEVIAASGC